MNSNLVKGISRPTKYEKKSPTKKLFCTEVIRKSKPFKFMFYKTMLKNSIAFFILNTSGPLHVTRF